MLRLMGMEKPIIHLYVPDHLLVACGEAFNHCVEHTKYRNRVTCKKCLKTPSFCEFCGCLTNARWRRCCDKGSEADLKKTQNLKSVPIPLPETAKNAGSPFWKAIQL